MTSCHFSHAALLRTVTNQKTPPLKTLKAQKQTARSKMKASFRCIYCIRCCSAKQRVCSQLHRHVTETDARGDGLPVSNRL